MALHLPLYRELYVISDLHLGGTRGTRIFDQGATLARLIQQLAKHAPGGPVGLVLNGDVIDSLAEGIEGYVASPQEAEDLVRRVLDHADFQPVWQALRDFLAAPKHHLVLAIGNHDLELAYPNVQELLTRELAPEGAQTPDDARVLDDRRGRIHFTVSGAGYRCGVGVSDDRAAMACIVHGNEHDDWNAVSPEQIVRLVRASTLGTLSDRTRDPPNAGTQLVIDVMNAVKKQYPFVDLLKPEIASVFNVLIALDPGQLKNVPRIMQALGRAKTVGARRVMRVLSGDELTAPSPVPVQSWQPGAHFESFLQEADAQGALLDEAWELSARELDDFDLANQEVLGEVSTFVKNTLRYVTRRVNNAPDEALRSALRDWVGSDDTWELDGPDSVFDALDRISPRANVVLAGHTHLRRCKTLSGGALYLNTGTWARLIRLREQDLQGKRWDYIWQALKKRTLQALDEDGRTPDSAPITLRQPTVAVVKADADGNVRAALCEPNDSGEPEPIPDCSWEPI